MKNIYLLLIALLIGTGFSNAQKPELNGVWKLTESHQYGDQTRTYISYLTFKDNGVIETELKDGLDITWLKNESENTLTITGGMFESIEGENKIESFNDEELKLINVKDETVRLQRLGLPNGKELTNKFTGEWLLEKVEKDGKTNLLNTLVNLHSNGILYFDGAMFGEWDYKDTTKGLFFNTREVKEDLN